ncbi:MAG TPA: DNA internalization-related competence protein ComEC/Rec2 [Gemmatimonadaceae bacterium]
MPLIAFAYLAFAGALLLAFTGFSTAGFGVAAVAIAYSAVRRDSRVAALSMLFAAGLLLGLDSATPARRVSRDEVRARSAAESLHFGGKARNAAARRIETLFGRDAPMAKALLIADQHSIPPEMRDRYARAGIIHMLSISGLHVAIIAAAISLACQVARVPKRMGAVVTILVTGLYVAIIGAPAPALRSAVMLAAGAVSRIVQRPTSPWASLALGAFAPLAVPRTILDLGYQLSVAGIAGLIASGALARRFLNSRLTGSRLAVSRDLLTSIVAGLVTAPLVAWYFGRVSLVGPVANLIAGPVIALLQPMLFLAMALAPLHSAAVFVASACHPLLALFDGIAMTAANVPGAALSFVPSLAAALLAGASVVLLIVAAVSRYPARPLIGSAGLLVAVVWLPVIPAPHSGLVEMHVLDVGQGDAILVRTDRGRWILFDAGRIWRSGDAGRSTIIPYVMRRGGKLVTFVLSHPHADHLGGAATVFRALHPPVFYDAAFAQGSLAYRNVLQTAVQSRVEWRRVHPGDEIQVDDVNVHFLAPDSAWTASLADPNEASTIALVQYRSVRFLLVGDAEQAEEQWLLEHARRDLRADVIKVAHHGSSTSSGDEFLAAVNPQAAIISVGVDNDYGHPSADVLSALGRVGAQVFRTDRQGTILVSTDGRTIMISADGERWDVSRN